MNKCTDTIDSLFQKGTAIKYYSSVNMIQVFFFVTIIIISNDINHKKYNNGSETMENLEGC